MAASRVAPLGSNFARTIAYSRDPQQIAHHVPPRTFIVAEAGVNHNGSTERAMAMVRAAATAGADAVKFQSFRTELEVTRTAPKADYQARNTGDAGSQFAMLKALELSEPDQRALMDACAAAGIEFMSTPFDPVSAAFLIGAPAVKRLKVASGELTNGPLLLQLARSGKPIVLSTGMADLDDVRAALAVLAFGYASPPDKKPSPAAFENALASPAGRTALRANVTLLHCTSDYPAPPNSINLRAMDTLAETFGLAVGLSDHSLGIAVAIAAVARGAAMIEKHFTIDRALPGPDHAASLTTAELAEMVAAIRTVELAFGDGRKLPAAAERPTRVVARKSLVALAPIRAGEAFSTANLGAKRPGHGVTPMLYWSYLGRPSPRAYAADDLIDPFD
ncbi:MAG: N-acetylneuraminate synthase [Rhodospirillaceae bacterium]|nr:N-acetylneuraminate synthase [Rhodospirillaceae bacterium]